MTTNDMDAEALLLDQTYFALGAEGVATFQELVDNPPATTDRLRLTLTSKAPWASKGAALGNTTGHDGKCALE
jgi:uncharacterized protein (DUF1778 family)